MYCWRFIEAPPSALKTLAQQCVVLLTSPLLDYYEKEHCYSVCCQDPPVPQGNSPVNSRSRTAAVSTVCQKLPSSDRHNFQGRNPLPCSCQLMWDGEKPGIVQMPSLLCVNMEDTEKQKQICPGNTNFTCIDFRLLLTSTAATSVFISLLFILLYLFSSHFYLWVPIHKSL